MTRPGRTVRADASVVAAPTPSLRRRLRRAFPLVDGVTYAIAAGALTTIWLVAKLLEALGSHLAGAP